MCYVVDWPSDVYGIMYTCTNVGGSCNCVYPQDICVLCGSSLYTTFLLREYFLSVCHKHNYIKMVMLSKMSIAVSVAFTCVPILQIHPPIVNLPNYGHPVKRID